MQQTKQSPLRPLRQRRGLSISELARQSGVHRTTITRWESGQAEPSITELERVLAILSATASERQEFWRHSDTPRALHYLRQEDSIQSLPLGDLLRALRFRAGKTQADAAREVGITQGLLARWENGAAVPDTARLHSLCFVLSASEAEVVGLTRGLYRDQTALPTDPEALYGSFNRLVYAEHSSQKSLLFLAHGAQFHRLIRQGYEGHEMLAQVWGRQAHYIQWWLRRDMEAIRIGESALTLLPSTARLDAHLTSMIIAVAQARIRLKQPEVGAKFLGYWLDRIADPIHRHWAQSIMAQCLYYAGESDTAIALSAEAFTAAGQFQEKAPGDYLNRMWDQASLLLWTGKSAAALSVLDTYSIFPSPHYNLADHTHELLLRAEANARLGASREAYSLISTVQANPTLDLRPYTNRLQRISQMIDR